VRSPTRFSRWAAFSASKMLAVSGVAFSVGGVGEDAPSQSADNTCAQTALSSPHVQAKAFRG
jgi:hypothetical protein